MKTSLVINKWKQSLEDDLILALASTSVLLLDSNKYPDELKPFFDYDDWHTTNVHIRQLFDIKRIPLPLTTTTSFLNVIEQFLNKDIDRDAAEIKLKAMSLQGKEKRMAKMLANLVAKLPFFALDENMNESELCSRFAEPFLAGLFDDPDNGVYLRWTDERTLEAKANESTRSRPDVCVTRSCGVKWTGSLAYGEAKPAVHGCDHFGLCRDLIKVAIFCKEALDSQLFEGILGIQIIGRTVVFYVLTLPAQSLYTLISIAKIQIPDSIQNLPALITEAPAILKVLDAFDRLCVRAAHPNVISNRHAPTLSMAKIHQLFSESKNRKRQCSLELRHN
ncbi:uncharacterized protein BYT42DRAFT_488769 [Radiomyces spectabilis]|uniref:uncharacterized protein n=1 Tax=Radiomyces spectabilis TaxID=64574 RepID=UPI00221E8D75|nr:uncharacterized protein BYT42DRAFT_488769 [Radiomyces spectabilis]KAI8393654.1 hypothetical protein BYT42DRAFT_488769 [Radiomyces spectabilis]